MNPQRRSFVKFLFSGINLDPATAFQGNSVGLKGHVESGKIVAHWATVPWSGFSDVWGICVFFGLNTLSIPGWEAAPNRMIHRKLHEWHNLDREDLTLNLCLLETKSRANVSDYGNLTRDSDLPVLITKYIWTPPQNKWDLKTLPYGVVSATAKNFRMQGVCQKECFVHIDRGAYWLIKPQKSTSG